MALGWGWRQGDGSGPFSGAGDRRRRGGRWGKARGGPGEPVEGLGRRWGGSWWRRHASRRPAAALGRGGGAPASKGGRGLVDELPWEVRNAAGWSFGEEGGRR